MKIPGPAAYLPLIAGAVGVVVAVIKSGNLKTELKRHVDKLIRNTEILSQGESGELPPLDDAPEEIRKVNENLKSTVDKMNELLSQVNRTRSLHQDDLKACREIYESFTRDAESRERVFAIIDQVKKTCGFERHFIFVKDSAAAMLNRENEISGEDGPLKNIILKDRKNRFNEILSKGEIQVVEDVPTQKNLRDTTRNWARKNKISSLAVLPVVTPDDPFALVLFPINEGEKLTEGQEIVMKLAGFVASSIISSDEKIQKTGESSRQLGVENRIYTSLLKVSRFKDLCRNFLETVKDLVPMDWGAVSVFDMEQNAYLMYSAEASDDIHTLKRSVIPVNGSGIFWVKENWKSWVEEDLTKTKPFTEDELYAHNGIHSRVIAPLYSDKRFVGALSIGSKKVGTYTPDLVKEIEKISQLLGPVLENSRLVTQLNKNIEELTDENQRLRKFYLNLGHEMRNPLNILKSIAHMSEEKSSSMTQEQVSEAFRFISQKTRYLSKAIDEVLDFSKAQLGKVDYNPEEFFLIEVLKDVLWEYQEDAKEKMLSLKWDVPKEMPEITGDREKMRIAFKELVGNAIKYTPDKGTITLKANLIPKLWIKSKGSEFFPDEVIHDVDPTVDQVLISITNTGPGIPQEKLQNIFRPPTEVPDKLKEEGGMGLGLPKVKQIIDLHRGMIWVTSKEGTGSRFAFNLPQYGRSWSILRTMLADKIDKAKQTLASLTVITLSLAEADELKQMLPDVRFVQLLKDLEKTVKSTIRDPRDVVWRLYDNETIIIISQVDIKKAPPLIERISESVREMKTSVLKDPPDVELTSITYPDEVLSANELISHLDKLVHEDQE